jgi:glutaredoxin
MKKLTFLLVCFLSTSTGRLCGDTDVPQSPAITLYYAPYCPFSREVLAYLNSIKKKIPMKNVKQDPKAKEDLKRLGGVLEVPCLMIGNKALYSSEAIIEWLKEHEDELEPM